MKKFLSLFTVFLLVFSAVAQDSCANEEKIEDLHAVSKCSIKTSQKKIKGNKGSRQISVQIFAPKQRFLKRKVKKEKVELSASNISLSVKSDINEKVEIKKKNDANLAKALSKLELRRAINFRKVDELPLFEKCKTVKKSEKTNCFNTEMVNHIQKYFNYPDEAVENKIQGDVWVRFIIDENGEVRNIKTLGPENGELLNKEAERVVTKLPKFAPGMKNGEKVPVKYGFPINFSLN